MVIRIAALRSKGPLWGKCEVFKAAGKRRAESGRHVRHVIHASRADHYTGSVSFEMNLGGCDGGITTLLPFVTVLVAESGLACFHGLPYLVRVEPKYPGKLRGATVRAVIGGWEHLRTLPPHSTVWIGVFGGY